MNQHLVIADLRHRLFKALQSSDHNLNLPPTLTVSPWVAMSLLQKAIRRSEVAWALSAAATLLKQSPDRLWRRLAVIAFEDVGQGDMVAVGHTLAATGSKLFREQLGGDERVAACVVRLLCEATKCRAADDLALICDWKPELEEYRANYADAPSDKLAGTMADRSECLSHRAIALWYLFGTDRLRPQNLGIRKGGVDAGLEALSELAIPATVLEVARLGIQRGAGTLAAFYPLLWSLFARDDGEMLNLTKVEMPTGLVGSLPAYVFDMHVREGRTAIRKFLQADCATARWIGTVNPQWGNQELIYGMLFRKESGCLTSALMGQISRIA